MLFHYICPHRESGTYATDPGPWRLYPWNVPDFAVPTRRDRRRCWNGCNQEPASLAAIPGNSCEVAEGIEKAPDLFKGPALLLLVVRGS